MKKGYRGLLLLIVIVMSINSIAFGESVPSNSLRIVQITDENLIPTFYTPLSLNGLNHIVYAYNDLQGETQYRVYGELNGTTGFYPIQITIATTQMNPTTKEEINVFAVQAAAGITALVEDVSLAGIATAATQEPAQIPQGYQKWGNQKGLYYFFNLFGEKEYRIYATFEKENKDQTANLTGETATQEGTNVAVVAPSYDFYPAIGETGTMVPGALAVNTMDDEQYIATNGKFSDKPATMAQGWKREVYITISQGEQVVVSTALPLFSGTVRLGETIAPSPTATISPATTKKPSTPTTSNNKGILSQGSKGESVVLLTRRLVILGYLDSSTRTYDQTVTAAVRVFQKDYKLNVDGMAGPTTLKKINALVPSTTYLS
ncbi:MAG: peptidoglycan-binding protein, partial [Clostridiales bacterium]|nr:peptidoglycan-binding protein [Clostridiales bacterium]